MRDFMLSDLAVALPSHRILSIKDRDNLSSFESICWPFTAAKLRAAGAVLLVDVCAWGEIYRLSGRGHAQQAPADDVERRRPAVAVFFHTGHSASTPRWVLPDVSSGHRSCYLSDHLRRRSDRQLAGTGRFQPTLDDYILQCVASCLGCQWSHQTAQWPALFCSRRPAWHWSAKRLPSTSSRLLCLPLRLQPGSESLLPTLRRYRCVYIWLRSYRRCSIKM